MSSFSEETSTFRARFMALTSDRARTGLVAAVLSRRKGGAALSGGWRQLAETLRAIADSDGHTSTVRRLTRVLEDGVTFEAIASSMPDTAPCSGPGRGKERHPDCVASRDPRGRFMRPLEAFGLRRLPRKVVAPDGVSMADVKSDPLAVISAARPDYVVATDRPIGVHVDAKGRTVLAFHVLTRQNACKKCRSVQARAVFAVNG